VLHRFWVKPVNEAVNAAAAQPGHDECMTYVCVQPADPTLSEMLSVRVHASLIAGLRTRGALGSNERLSTLDAGQLLEWAERCENPGGQRAAVARLLANVIVAGNGAVLVGADDIAGGGFWSSVARM
jgi:hypothetical protein